MSDIDEQERAAGSPTSTQTLDHGVDSKLITRFVLRVIEGPDAGVSHASRGERVIVGTHESVDLVLSDSTVSRFHFEIEAAPAGMLLRDLGSRNGTRVNGVQVFEARVEPGATITCGRTRFSFSVEGGAVSMPLSPRTTFGRLVGQSQAMRQAFAHLERASTSKATVLLLGETGTGKEAAAESIHAQSARAEGPFVVVDCGAIPEQLLESELFGHEKGSFTGATSAREGAFEAASGGTLFLDEIGELPPDLQPKLLRALERREVKRVGSNRYVPVDVRIIAATHRDLRGEVNGKRFRSDLFYRLAVLEIRLPPLRERREDLPLLVSVLASQLDADREQAASLVRAPSFIAELERHSWPGNVRELRNYLERCLVLGGHQPVGDPLAGAEAPSDIDVSIPIKQARARFVDAFERAYLERIVARHEGNVSAAARAAGVDRMHFYRMLWRHGLK